MIATLTEIKFANYTHRYDFTEGFLLVSPLPDGELKWAPLSLLYSKLDWGIRIQREICPQKP